MELPPREEFQRQPMRAALGMLWDLIHALAADHERRIQALENPARPDG